jgi:hypothetical protein
VSESRGRTPGLRALGAEPVGATGVELAATLRATDATWGEAVRAAGPATRN